ncbi:MAG: hypothetical protein ACRC33_07295 [Gemmataceae bacterium]
MAINTRCPSCKVRLQYPDDLAGRRVLCKDCERPVRVPEADAGEDVNGEEEGETRAAAREDAGPPPPWFYGVLSLCALATLAAGTALCAAGVVVLAHLLQNADAGNPAVAAVALGVLAGSVGALVAAALSASLLLLAGDIGRSLRGIKWNTARPVREESEDAGD